MTSQHEMLSPTAQNHLGKNVERRVCRAEDVEIVKTVPQHPCRDRVEIVHVEILGFKADINTQC